MRAYLTRYWPLHLLIAISLAIVVLMLLEYIPFPIGLASIFMLDAAILITAVLISGAGK